MLALKAFEQGEADDFITYSARAPTGLLRRMMRFSRQAALARDTVLAKGSFLHLLHQTFAPSPEYRRAFEMYLNRLRTQA